MSLLSGDIRFFRIACDNCVCLAFFFPRRVFQRFHFSFDNPQLFDFLAANQLAFFLRKTDKIKLRNQCKF